MIFLRGVSEERIVQCSAACGDSLGFERGKHTQLEPPSLGSCRDGPPRGAAACGPAGAGPRSAAAAAAAVDVNAAAATAAAAAAVVVSADVNGAEAAVAAVVPSPGQSERKVY